MALTLRNDAKNEIIKILRKQGYGTYSKLLGYFDIFLTDDDNVIGYMIPNQAKIVLNKGLNIDQVSTIVRHEILHEYLTHGPRQEKFDAEHPELNPQLAPGQLSNIAADYEISNRGYTDADKSIARRIKLGDRVLKALVTEDEHPDWVDLPYEEMYKRLLEQSQQDREEIQKLLDQMSELSNMDPDDLIQDAKDIQDQMEDDKTSSGSNSNSDSKQSNSQGYEDSDSTSDTAEDIQDAAEAAEKAAKKLKKDAENAASKSQQSADIFDTPEEQQAKADVAARAKQIRDFIDDLKNKTAVFDEASRARDKEKEAKSARDVQRYMGSGIQQFKMNLNRFIQTQIDEEGDPQDTYRILDPRYEDTDFLMPGRVVYRDKKIPLVNVYHDVSGSFDTAEKTAAAMKAIETLNNYVRSGDLEIKLYYFANRVSDDKSKAGGGTYGTPILDHIEKTRPTNVIVITDGDIHDCSRVVTVPGAVWMLFYDSRSENLMEHLKGKRQNKYYDIEY